MIIHISVLQIRRQTLMWRGEEEEWVQKVHLMFYPGAWGWEFTSLENGFWEFSLKLSLKACSA